MPKSRKVQTPADAAPLLSLARQVRGWADTVLSVAGNATDLGLTLAQNFIQQHHGSIEANSRPGCTCFTVLLPLHTTHQESQ